MRLEQVACIAFWMLLLACISGCGRRASASPASAPYELATITRTGGFAPADHVIRFISDGHFTIRQMRDHSDRAGSGQLSEAQLRRLVALLEATKSLQARYENPAARDAFEYTLNREGTEIRWSEAAAKLPPELRQLAEMDTALLSAGFPPPTTATRIGSE